MNLPRRIASLLLLLSLSLPAMALSLNEAMSALGPAKASGQLGEMANGYLGVVKPGGQASEIARLINQARRAEYQRLANENGIKLGDVEAIAGQKALEKTPPGQYIQLQGQWRRK
ncbi:YdbL family protein [Pseudomonas sp. LPB0260]|uniref:YdbL family protein n=1 Tax=unclassified Pseudomonas TaxID=196821 RepID=UPI0015C29442|nr:YdbL family protein [Pseudomonas sp. LPB0260]QLC74321.1 YdbL family protein [Pseudomonas sp. LPB0260]QLC77091.1 YdbL family protein [Pseudomonas sp. LPB0260]